MGLREQQKNERMRHILDAAAALFGRDGFEHVKAEQIAEMAKVSVGTLYNYFPGKNEILMTLIAIENERLEEIGRSFQPDPDASIADAFCAFLHQYFAPQHLLLDKAQWSRGFAISFAEIASKEARRLRHSDRVLSKQVVDFAKKMQSDGFLRKDVDCDVFGAALFNNANMLFLDFARSENRTYQQVTEGIDAMTRALVHIAQPVNGSGA